MSQQILGLLAVFCVAVTAIAGGPQEGVQAAWIDVQTRPELERPFLRYLVLAHLPAEERQEMWQVIAGHVNGTSRKAAIYRPAVLLMPAVPGGRLVEADGIEVRKEDWQRAVVIRVNFAYYGWRREVVETLALVEPHFHYRERKVGLTKVPVKVVTAPQVPAVVGAVGTAGDPEEIVLVEIPGTDRLREKARRNVDAGEVVWVRRRGQLVKEGAAGEQRQAVQQGQQAVQKTEQQRQQNIHGAWLPKEIGDLALATQSDAPIMLADWFWWQTSIQAERDPGPGYYDLLDIKNRDDFLARVGFDAKIFKEKFREFAREYREAVAESGVSRQPRRIAVFDKLGGELWVTFDNKLALGDRNPLDTPDDSFKFDASEDLAHLPNGIMAMGLFDSNGVRQDTAPDFIGPDSTSTDRDGRIHVGQCFRCHNSAGFKDFDGWYRSMYRPPVMIGGPDFQKILDLQEQYFTGLTRKVKSTKDRHTLAILEATGLTTERYSTAIRNQWLNVNSRGVDLARAGRELGVDPDVFQQAWQAYKAPPNLNGLHVLDVFLQEKKRQRDIPVRQFWDCVSDAHKAIAAWQTVKGK